jgi:hypothetical protein
LTLKKAIVKMMVATIPMETVGTPKQGYPLLQYEGAVSTRLSLVVWQKAPDPTTWTAPGPPRDQEKTICSKASTVGPDPYGKVSDPCIYGRTSG